MIKQENGYRGICCFDVDRTLTCGKRENLRNAVQECRKNNHKVAIVTARGVRTLFPIRPKNLGFPKDFRKDVRYGDFWTFNERKQALKKAEQMEELRKKYSTKNNIISRSNVYLFDDKPVNIRTVNENGFTGVQVNKCNLSKNLVSYSMKKVQKMQKLAKKMKKKFDKQNIKQARRKARRG